MPRPPAARKPTRKAPSPTGSPPPTGKRAARAGKPDEALRTKPKRPAVAKPGKGRAAAGPRWTDAAATGSGRLRTLRRVPGFVYGLISVLAVILGVPTINWLYQVVRKPSELFFPVSDDLYKTPADTWRSYAPLFLAHSTSIMTPELLAALAQKEASGNPVARTYWRWSATLKPFDIYRPASSAVGMYQFIDGTFDEARRYCIHDHRVVADGPWHDWDSCWFNGLYTRVIPSHAVELAASNLDRRVREILSRKGITRATLRQQQELAIITHLCGAGAGAAHAARGLRLRPGQRCGTHDANAYVARVMGLMRTFAALRQRAEGA
jgi:hypothetical protein